MKPIVWRNQKFVVFAPDADGFEARLHEGVADDELSKRVGFGAWFETLEAAIDYAQKSSTPTPKEGNLL